MKAKGDAYEREVAAHINSRTGLKTAHRAPLSGGGNVGLSGGADLGGTPGLFIECKRTERLNIRSALDQAERNVIKTNSPEVPIVVTRQSRVPTGDSIVALRLDAFLDLYRIYLTHIGEPLMDPTT